MKPAGISHQGWLNRAAALKPPDRLVIGGRPVPARTGATAHVWSPRDRACLAEAGDGAAADVDAAAAVAVARGAFGDSSWSRPAPAQRKVMLRRLADAVEANRDELALLVSLERCTAPARLVAHRAVHAELLAALTSVADALRVGDPLDPATQMGPLVSAAHGSRVEGHVEQAKAEGARAVTGPTAWPRRVPAVGWYTSPTVLDGVTAGMRVSL